jgi:hypothetical protein
VVAALVQLSVSDQTENPGRRGIGGPESGSHARGYWQTVS